MEESKMNVLVGVALALLCETSWTEPHKKEPGQEFRRALKTLPMELMDELERRGFVRAAINSRTLHITDAGYESGKRLMRYFRAEFARFIGEVE
jgi:methylphosphotriester-DNA--protein-cysteine methyltransferase